MNKPKPDGRRIACFVPLCPNTTTKHPDKLFVVVNKSLKEKWCMKVNIHFNPARRLFCCEDHLNLEEDLENYQYWKLMKGKATMKPTARLQNYLPNEDALCNQDVVQISENQETASELLKQLLQSTENQKLTLKEECNPCTSSPSTYPIISNIMELDQSDSEPKPKVETEINTVFGKCRCCLQNGYMKNLWEEHQYEENREVFGEMIMETFAIAWEEPEGSKPYICEWCIVRLRDATNFKQQVLACQQFMEADSDVEYEDEKPNQDSTWEEDEKPNQDLIWDEDEEAGQLQNSETDEMDAFKDEPEYEDLEFLEEYEDVVESTSNIKESEPEQKKTRKRRLAASDEYTIYKNYSTADMKKAVTSVLDDTMSIGEASLYFNIPRKTIAGRVLAIKKNPDKLGRHPVGDGPDKTERPKDREQVHKHKANVYAILNYSNATPLRAYRASGFVCYFCMKKFPDASDLKEHTTREHKISLKTLHKHFTLYWTLKMDVTNLTCNICEETHYTLKKLLAHLKEHSKNVFPEIKNQIIPYSFYNGLYCVECGQNFKFFKLLTDHLIQEHYKIYDCPKCPRGFINKKNLPPHLLRHDRGEFNCSTCYKEFESRVNLLAHERKQCCTNRKFKCRYCEEEFSAARLVREHEEERHNAYSQVQCAMCKKSVSSQWRLKEHLERIHMKLKKFCCIECGVSFLRKSQLEDHMIKHTKEKRFICGVCAKPYSRRRALVEHMRLHTKDFRFSCQICGQKFAQKISLEKHLTSKHDYD